MTMPSTHGAKTEGFEVVDRGDHLLWRLSRPEVHNAVDEAVVEGLEQALDRRDREEDLRPIVLTGDGDRTFCAGGDLAWFSALDAGGAGEMSRRIGGLLDRLHRGPQVVVAAVNGDVWGGGCELLTACHLRVASSTAKLAFRQARLGVSTGWGGASRLFQAIGRGAALELLLSAEAIDMGRAREIGLIQRVVPPGEVLPEAERLASRIAGLVPEALAAFLELSRLEGEELRAREAELFRELWDGPAFRSSLARWADRQGPSKD